MRQDRFQELDHLAERKLIQFTKLLLTAVLITACIAGVLSVRAADKDKMDHAKPYPLYKCIVCDDKLGDKSKPHVFTYEGQEIKLCCIDCLKHFKKKPAKYFKKIEERGKEKN
jgi:YHS domain-containing protein